MAKMGKALPIATINAVSFTVWKPTVRNDRNSSGTCRQSFVDLRHRHVDHAIAAFGELRSCRSARAPSADAAASVGRHELDHNPQRKRYEVRDVRTDRNLALEAATGETAVH